MTYPFGSRIKCLVDVVSTIQLLHVCEPARDIWAHREIAAREFAQRDQIRLEVVGDRDLVTAEPAAMDSACIRAV
jgi:hypothetical protein